MRAKKRKTTALVWSIERGPTRGGFRVVGLPGKPRRSNRQKRGDRTYRGGA